MYNETISFATFCTNPTHWKKAHICYYPRMVLEISKETFVTLHNEGEEIWAALCGLNYRFKDTLIFGI